jgi:hypothetical protein
MDLVDSREGGGHLVPQLPYLLVVYFHPYGPLFEVLFEFLSTSHEVVLPIFVELTHVQAIFNPYLFQLLVVPRKHDLKGLSFVVHDVLGQAGGNFLRQIPL